MKFKKPLAYQPTVDSEYSSLSSSTSSAFAPIRLTTTNPPPPTDDPIVRRALERFNSQVQNSLMTNSSYSRPPGGHFYDQHPSTNLMTTSATNAGYQSIIGRRRQTRYDEPVNPLMKEHSTIGDGYSSSVFANPPQSYYMNMSDDVPPVIPPRYRRDEPFNDTYRRYSTDDYLSENTNNNNNTHPYSQENYIHHAYPATITNATSFRPIHIHYNQQYDTSNVYSRDRTQSNSSSNSSDSVKQIKTEQSGRIVCHSFDFGLK